MIRRSAQSRRLNRRMMATSPRGNEPSRSQFASKTMTGDQTRDGAGSPPCFLHELNADGTPGLDPVQARDVARWRKAERERLIAARLKLTLEFRAAQASA